MDVSARALVARRGDFTLEVPVFDAGPGGTAVLGPNGAGKTTLLLALQGLVPGTGTVDRPTRCAAVFARPAVLRGSLLWNVSVVVQSALRTTRADSDIRARRALAATGLADTASDARTLSTGQRQRLALARALACEPQALFLDEPFANVDADGRPAMRALIRSWTASSGCALVLATSSLADATALCVNVLALRGGFVSHRGTVADVANAREPYVAALVAEARAAD